jgi:hypothetical protein
MIRQWILGSGLNVDSVMHMSSQWWPLAKWFFYYPGDFCLQAIMRHTPHLATLLEISRNSFGGSASGLISLGCFLAATVGIESARFLKGPPPRRFAAA